MAGGRSRTGSGAAQINGAGSAAGGGYVRLLVGIGGLRLRVRTDDREEANRRAREAWTYWNGSAATLDGESYFAGLGIELLG